MKTHDLVMVSTSKFFADQIGIVTEITNQGTAKVKFGDQIGFYTIDKNDFVLVKSS